MDKNVLLMDTSESTHHSRVTKLTKDTSNALVTLNGRVDLTKTLLNKGASYILLGDFQSDRLEGEFIDNHAAATIISPLSK